MTLTRSMVRQNDADLCVLEHHYATRRPKTKTVKTNKQKTCSIIVGMCIIGAVVLPRISELLLLFANTESPEMVPRIIAQGGL